MKNEPQLSAEMEKKVKELNMPGVTGGRTEMNNDGKWCTSRDGELFDGGFFDTKQEAVDDFIKELKQGFYGETIKKGYFYVGRCFKHSAAEFFDAGDVIDNAWERASDEAGEWAENWLDGVNQKQRDELQVLIMSWVEKHGLEPTFYRIKDEEKVVFSGI